MDVWAICGKKEIAGEWPSKGQDAFHLTVFKLPGISLHSSHTVMSQEKEQQQSSDGHIILPSFYLVSSNILALEPNERFKSMYSLLFLSS